MLEEADALFKHERDVESGRAQKTKKPLSLWNSGFFLKLVANQGLEPRTCGL
jgi:hypothetical protein